MNTSIPNWLVQRTYLTPNRLALSYQGRTWTFQEMMEEVERVIHGILPLKLECGERVAILMKNRPNTVWTIHALQQLGVETVFLNTRLTVQELLFQLNDSETRHILYDRDFTEIIKSLEVEMNIEVHSIDDLLHIKQEQFHMRKEFNLEDVCSIMYTSGTTGSPKGVLQTYGNHWWSAIGSSLNLGLDQKDAWLCAVPLYHISGLSIFMRSVIYGMPVYLMDQFDEAQSIMLLRSGKITIMSVVTTMLNRLIRSLDEEVIHPNFRCMLLGGGPAPLPLLQKCLSKQIPVFQSYGMTETASQIITLSPEDSMSKIGSAGKPLFPSQVKIVSRDGIAVPNGQHGEIVVKGPNVMKGYLNRAEANKDSFIDGWFHTGDIGYLDEEGFLYVLDRRSDLIVSGGENIYPAEIESVLMNHPDIIEVGVVGVDDDEWGQVPYAFYTAQKQLYETDLHDYCRDRLATYKIPKRFLKIPSLPRNGSNKLMRRKLLESIQNR